MESGKFDHLSLISIDFSHGFPVIPKAFPLPNRSQKARSEPREKRDELARLPAPEVLAAVSWPCCLGI
jgi:hypothetical protein